MNAELLSRLQFALTASFHFIYPPLSMGLGLMMVVIGIIYVRTKDPKWRQAVVLLGQSLRPDLRGGRRDRRRAGI